MSKRERSASVLKIGLGQVQVTMGDKRANVREIFSMVSEAAAQRCDLLALPECSLAGWLSSAAATSAEPIPGPFTRRLCAAARRDRMAIAVGLEERSNEGVIYNSALLIDSAGTILVRHRKINELAVGQAVYSRGAGLAVVPFRGRAVALSICADSWRPEITDALYLIGARAIISPGAWAVEEGGEATNLDWIRETYRQRAEGRELFIIAPNGVGPVTEGPWAGRVLQGNSLIIGPGGQVIACGPAGRGLVCAQVPWVDLSARFGNRKSRHAR